MSAVSVELTDFFDAIWQDTEGFVYLPVKEVSSGRVRKFFIPWPEKKDQVVRHVLRWAADDTAEVFFSPALYSEMKATNEAVLGSWVAWVDFDGNFPAKWPEGTAPRPNIEVQSSVAGKRHAYWKLDEFHGRKEIEKVNRSLSYALSADTSGWDANQFLRPPFSVNRKYAKPLTTKIVADRQEIVPYDDEAFASIPTPAEAIRAEIELDGLPTIEEVKALAKWDEDILGLFETETAEAKSSGFDRSGALARLAYKGAELSWTDEQIYVALLDADGRWGKYAHRSTQQKILIELINRARAKVGYEVGELTSLISKAKERELPPDEYEIPEFISIDALNAVPGIDNWLVEGLLVPKGIGLFTGRPGTGKTQLGLQLACDLATGRSKFIDFALPGEPKKVLFLSLEMAGYQLQHFTSKIRVTYPEKCLNENLVLYSKGESLPLHTDVGQHLMEAWFEEYKPDVVLIDSLSQAVENLSDDDQMKKLFDFLKHVRRYHNTGIIFIHHHRKKANDAQARKQPNSQSDIYGSYQISASVDFALDLEDRGAEGGELELKLLKARFTPIGETTMLARDENLHFTVAEVGEGNFETELPDPSGNGGLNLGL